ncbi:MAG: hypothetical protein LC620_07440, partial [Halobacteriales archaeon]|nr:hypothetical protein [Halobacteriales archaeon]
MHDVGLGLDAQQVGLHPRLAQLLPDPEGELLHAAPHGLAAEAQRLRVRLQLHQAAGLHRDADADHQAAHGVRAHLDLRPRRRSPRHVRRQQHLLRVGQG